MRFTSASPSTARYARIGPIFFDDRIVGVLDGKYVLGSVNRKDVAAIGHETRKSFKHPILGSAFGLALVAASLLLFLALPISSICMFVIALYVLWGVVSRRDEPWIVFRLAQSERAFPLRKRISEDETARLAALLPAVEQVFVPGYDPGRGRGFEVLPAKPGTITEKG